MGIGAVFVNQLVKFDEKLKEDLDKMLERAREANEQRYIGTVLTCSDISWLQFLCSLFCHTVASFSHNKKNTLHSRSLLCDAIRKVGSVS